MCSNRDTEFLSYVTNIPDTFQVRWENYKNKLMNSDKLTETIMEFATEKDYEDMIFYLLGQDEFKSIWKVNGLIARDKSNIRATYFRELGDSAFKNRTMDLALKFYNRSIIHAEHTPSSNALALAYDSRSAALYEMEQYKRCLVDLERVYVLDYPGNTSDIVKLKIREKQCKLHLGYNIEAPKKWKPKKSKLVLQSELFSTCCVEEMNIQLIGSDYSEGVDRYCHMFNTDHYRPMQEMVANPNVPALTCAAVIDYTELKGRYLYTTEDIYPGDMVLKEESYSFSLFASHLYSNCTYCGISAITPVPCPTCTTVIFCSEECLNFAMKKFHKIECNMLASLMIFDDMGMSVMLLRTIISESWSTVKENFFLHKPGILEHNRANIGYNESGMYLSDDYSAIYHPNPNKLFQKPVDVLERCCVAMMLLQFIAFDGTYIGMEYKEISDDLDEDLLVLANVLVELSVKSLNSYPVYEQIYYSEKHRITEQQFAHRYNSVLSIMTQSCTSPLIACNYGRQLVIRASKFIKSGSELTMSFIGMDYKDGSILERNQRFSKARLQCRCDACKDEWPVPPEPTEDFNLVLTCPFCQDPLDRVVGCAKCKAKRFALPEHMTVSPGDKLTVQKLYTHIKKAIKKNDAEMFELTSLKQLQDIFDTIALCNIFAKDTPYEMQLQTSARGVLALQGHHVHFRYNVFAATTGVPPE